MRRSIRSSGFGLENRPRPLNLTSDPTHNVCNGVDLGACVHDVQLLGVLVAGGDGTDVGLVLLAAAPARPNQRLAAPRDGRVRHGMEPRENLGWGHRGQRLI